MSPFMNVRIDILNDIYFKEIYPAHAGHDIFRICIEFPFTEARFSQFRSMLIEHSHP